MRIMLLCLVLLPQAPAFAAYLGNLQNTAPQSPVFESVPLLTETAVEPVFIGVFVINGDLYYGFICNNDPMNFVDVLGARPILLDGAFWKAWGGYAWNEGPVGGFRKWRSEEAIPTYTSIFLGEENPIAIMREGIPAAHGFAVDNVVNKVAIRQAQGSGFGYAFFQSAVGDPILGGVGVLPIMESVAGYDSLTGVDISTADRYERAGMGVFRIGATGALMAGAYNPNATFSSSLSSLNYTGTGFAGAKTWATTYQPLVLDKSWLTSFQVNSRTPYVWKLSDKTTQSPRVFWSGGSTAKDAAEAFARQTGGQTLEMTRFGRFLDTITTRQTYPYLKPLWNHASRSFATGAEGPINVFHSSRGVRLESVWRTVEYPKLMEASNPIIYHVTP